ncbi:hypothetical protein ALC53_12086 [Atta colombica]|uniref:Uncharacterized protein n=1 Tax=Atta colombica TaxID=520822 RepID=A0A195AZI9_9HYME|nr:hypothetical protein ALC53_12086 [Atta colombica]
MSMSDGSQRFQTESSLSLMTRALVKTPEVREERARSRTRKREREIQSNRGWAREREREVARAMRVLIHGGGSRQPA